MLISAVNAFASYQPIQYNLKSLMEESRSNNSCEVAAILVEQGPDEEEISRSGKAMPAPENKEGFIQKVLSSIIRLASGSF